MLSRQEDANFMQISNVIQALICRAEMWLGEPSLAKNIFSVKMQNTALSFIYSIWENICLRIF